MTRAIITITVLACLFAASADAKPKPKPYSWTTAVAVSQLERANPSPWRAIGTVEVARCAGKGKQIARRYLAFACSVTFQPRALGEESFNDTLFVRVRAFGKGEPCVSTKSLRAVPKACLNPKGKRTPGDRQEAAAVLQGKLQTELGLPIPYQGPTGCLGYGAGYFECWFGTSDPEDPAAGLATLILSAKPVLVVTKQAA